MGLMQAIVKSVLSGDTLVLHNMNNPAQERVISLAYVSAPRLKKEGDEVNLLFEKKTKRKKGKNQRNVLYIHNIVFLMS